MTCGIYKIENLINHKIYIGQSIHIEKRWMEHCIPSTKSLVGKAINKYGKENFSFQIIEQCEEHLLNERESYYIQYYQSLVPNGYNIEEKDTERTQYFCNYTKDVLFKIISDIKNSELSFSEIAIKYGLDLSMIYYLNRGDYHTLKGEIYPLREVKGLKMKKIHYCSNCGVEIKTNANLCVDCAHKAQRRCERPNREELKDLIRVESFVGIGKIYGVTDNAVKKWCKNYGLPSRKSDIKQITDEEWLKM